MLGITLPKKISITQNLVVFLILTTVFLCSSWTLLNNRFFRTHDYVHGARIVEMTQALAEGHFPVRWSPNLGYGFGMPLFEFYAPLPYYVGSLFYWLGLDLVWSVKLLILMANLGTIVGGYLLGKNLLGKNNAWAGVLCAAALTLAPYRAVNLFVRGAFSEAWGIMFMPWILLFIILLANKRTKFKRNWTLLVLSLVGLFLSHNLMTLMFVPLSLVFAIAYFLSVRKSRRLSNFPIRLFGAYVLGAGLAAFYLLPAFLEKDLTQIGSILSGYFHYSHHFIYIRQLLKPNWGYEGSAWGPDDGMSFFLGWGQIFGLLVSTVLGGNYYLKHSKKVKKIPIFLIFSISGFLTGSCLYLSLLKSKFLWDTIPLFSYIQFSWRFIGVATIFLGLMIACGLFFLQKKTHQYLYISVVVLLTLLNTQYFRPKEFLSSSDDFYYHDTTKIQTQMSGTLPDYAPKDLDLLQVERMHPETQFSLNGIWSNPLRTDEFFLVNKSHQKLFRANFHEDLSLGFRVASFPGWRVEIDGHQVDWSVGSFGNIEVNVPAGEHLVGLYFGRTPVRLWGDLISLFCLLIFVSIIVEKPSFIPGINMK